MKHAPRKRAASRAKESSTLLSSFCKVRILHYAAAKPVTSLRILEQLRNHGCSITPATLNRILLRLTRNGWLKVKSPAGPSRRAHRTHSLTPKGRKGLNLSRGWLTDLVEVLQQS